LQKDIIEIRIPDAGLLIETTPAKKIAGRFFSL